MQKTDGSGKAEHQPRRQIRFVMPEWLCLHQYFQYVYKLFPLKITAG